MGITKTRMAAKRLCDAGKILVRGHVLKPSADIFPEMVLEVLLPQKELRLKILEVPSSQSVAKPARAQFMSLENIKEL